MKLQTIVTIGVSTVTAAGYALRKLFSKPFRLTHFFHFERQDSKGK